LNPAIAPTAFVLDNIAATALAPSHVVVTRHGADFESTGLEIVYP
jgi:hypothetical protein